MSIKKYILLLFISILIISCKTTAQKDKSYEVLNDVFEQLDNDLEERLIKSPKSQYLKARLQNPLYINPKFSYLLVSMSGNTFWKSPDIKNDLWVIDYIPVLRNCSKKFQIEDLKLIKDSIYYINQVKNTPEILNLSKIVNKRVLHYKTDIEEEKHIKYYENWKKQGIDSITLKNRKKLMLGEENGYFQVSYPIFSRDGKYAIIYIEKDDIGMQFWILEKSNEKWKKACAVHIGTIN